MKGVDDHNKEDPPRGGKIRKEGQREEEGLASAKEVCRTAIQVHDRNAVFLLMVEARIATATALLSTVALGGGSIGKIIICLFSKHHF